MIVAMEQHVQPEGLGSFSQPVQNWFQNTFGKPTLPQEAGWPPIQRGEHTLLLAPTGSGKTLAAFLWGIDRLFRELAPEEGPVSHPLGIRLLYISPLKALNNDIERNLRVPLAGIRQAAADLGLGAPDVHVAVRSGDTPPRERRAALRRPPHILITTPESLYLMLTSPRARTLFHGAYRPSWTKSTRWLGTSAGCTSPSASNGFSISPRPTPTHRPLRDHPAAR